MAGVGEGTGGEAVPVVGAAARNTLSTSAATSAATADATRPIFAATFEIPCCSSLAVASPNLSMTSLDLAARLIALRKNAETSRSDMDNMAAADTTRCSGLMRLSRRC